MMLTNGNIVEASICEDCYASPLDLDKIWSNLLADWRKAGFSGPEASALMHREHCIVGLLFLQPWNRMVAWLQ